MTLPDQSVPDRFFIYSRRRGQNQIIDRFGGRTISVHARKRDAERECRNLELGREADRRSKMKGMALDRRSLHVLVEAVPTEPDGFYWRGLGWVGAERVIEATGPSREGVASACMDAVELALTATGGPQNAD